MTADQFIDLVAEMRKWQRHYFATRSAESLRKSKQLEREIDRWLAGRNAEGQARIFDEERT